MRKRWKSRSADDFERLLKRGSHVSPWQLARQHLYSNSSYTPYIGSFGEGMVSDDLWSHVWQTISSVKFRLFDFRFISCYQPRIVELGENEITQFDGLFIYHQNITWFEIFVHNLLLVQVLQTQ